MSRSLRTFVVVVDQNGLFREGLRRILADTAFRVGRDAATLEEVLKDLPGKIRPQLLLLSAGADYVATAHEIERFKTTYPEARVVVLSDRCDFDSVMAVLQVGANGFVLKRIDCRAFAKSLELVMLGQSVLSSSVVDLFTQQQLEPQAVIRELPTLRGEYPLANSEINEASVSQKFSTREIEILDCLTRGEANKFIARRFAIAEATVKVHVKAILRKIRAKNRTQAAIWARDFLPASSNVTVASSIAEDSETTADPGPPERTPPSQEG